MIIYSIFLIIFGIYVFACEKRYTNFIRDELQFLNSYNTYLNKVRHEYYRTGSVIESAPDLMAHRLGGNRFEKLFLAVAMPVLEGGDVQKEKGSVFLNAVLRIQQEIAREIRYLSLSRHKFSGLALTAVWPLLTIPMIAYWAGNTLSTLQSFYIGPWGYLVLFLLAGITVLCFEGIDMLRCPFFMEHQEKTKRRRNFLAIEKQKDRLKRQDELKRFRYVIEMMKDIDGTGPIEVLESMEYFSEKYRQPISECLNSYAVDSYKAFDRLNQRTEGEMGDLCDAFIAAWELGVSDAFDEITSQIEIVREESENNRNMALDNDVLLGEILAGTPGLLILFGYLIIPFLVKALAMFNSYQETLQEFMVH